MALLDSELQMIRVELGWPGLSTGAEPWIGITSLPTIIQTYMLTTASTTSTTSITAATSKTPVAVTLASATGFATGVRVVVDEEERQELSTVVLLSGSVATIPLMLAHSGTYPVTVEGSESYVRYVLTCLREAKSGIRTSLNEAGIKKVDEIEFFQPGTSSTIPGLSSSAAGKIGLVRYWRSELSRTIFGEHGRGGGGMENY